jgi:hypothetical protein
VAASSDGCRRVHDVGLLGHDDYVTIRNPKPRDPKPRSSDIIASGGGRRRTRRMRTNSGVQGRNAFLASGRDSRTHRDGERSVRPRRSNTGSWLHLGLPTKGWHRHTIEDPVGRQYATEWRASTDSSQPNRSR